MWITSVDSEEENVPIHLGDYFVVDTLGDAHTLLLTKGQRNSTGDLYPVIGGGVYIGDIQGDGEVEVKEVVNPSDYGKTHRILGPTSFTPDRSAIACIGGYEDVDWLVSIDGSNHRRVVSGDYCWMESKWSPDSTRIAFMRGLYESGPIASRGALSVVDLESTSERQVLTPTRDDGPWSWTSDSERIIELRKGDDGAFFSLHSASGEGTDRPMPLGADLPNPAELTLL
jgi:hypothetical protein